MQEERIEVLTLLPADSPQFTVNTGALSVNIARPAVPVYDFHLYRSNGVKTFTAGDSFMVLSAGLVLPESFVFASAPLNVYQNNISFALGLQDTIGGGVYYLTNFGTNGVQMPIENYELPLNIFVDVNNVDPGGSYPFRTKNFRIALYVRGLDEGTPIRPQVSMIGVDPLLNTSVQRATAFVKIVHNRDMV